LLIYDKEFHAVAPSPILNLFVSVSMPTSPCIKTGLALVH
jgi:hypothetical protein